MTPECSKLFSFSLHRLSSILEWTTLKSMVNRMCANRQSVFHYCNFWPIIEFTPTLLCHFQQDRYEPNHGNNLLTYIHILPTISTGEFATYAIVEVMCYRTTIAHGGKR